jgi:rRNA maturation endonuclease Nob1
MLLGTKHDTHLGKAPLFEGGNGCMGYVICAFCGTTSLDSTFCPACGKRRKKWCPQSGDWKASNFTSLEHNDGVVLAESVEEARFCPDCGAELQAKAGAHE